MSRPLNKVYDQYASVLNYKNDITVLNRPAVSVSWIPENNLRRIKAYEVYHAYYDNYSRDYRLPPDSGGTSHNDNIVEVGDPAWFCDKLKSKLLGDDIKLTIPIPRRLAIPKHYLLLLTQTRMLPLKW